MRLCNVVISIGRILVRQWLATSEKGKENSSCWYPVGTLGSICLRNLNLLPKNRQRQWACWQCSYQIWQIQCPVYLCCCSRVFRGLALFCTNSIVFFMHFLHLLCVITRTLRLLCVISRTLNLLLCVISRTTFTNVWFTTIVQGQLTTLSVLMIVFGEPELESNQKILNIFELLLS